MLFFDPISGQWYPGSSIPAGVNYAFVDGGGNNAFVDLTGAMVVQMVTRLSVTIDQDGLRDGETRHAELVQAAEMLWRIGNALVSSGALTGTVLDRNGVATGHWTYTPTAPS